MSVLVLIVLIYAGRRVWRAMDGDLRRQRARKRLGTLAAVQLARHVEGPYRR